MASGTYPSEPYGAYHGSMRSVRNSPDLVVICRASLKWLTTWYGLRLDMFSCAHRSPCKHPMIPVSALRRDTLRLR